MRELYYGDLDSITRLVRQGNPDLEPENGLAVKGGVRFAAREKLTGTGEGFYKRTRNLIEPDYQPRQVGFANIKDAEHYGVNLTTRYQPNQRFTARLNYSYLLARDKKTGFTLLHRPEHYLRTEGEYRSSYFRNQLAPQVRLAAQYQSGARTYHLAAGREKDLPAVVVFDFTALVNILDAVLMFRVENLFDQEYAFADGPTMPGRVYRMGIRWNFWN
jgi:outer membrane cobalamin receptor